MVAQVPVTCPTLQLSLEAFPVQASIASCGGAGGVPEPLGGGTPWLDVVLTEVEAEAPGAPPGIGS